MGVINTIKTKILIVEDLNIIANDLKVQLEKWGYLVTGISNNGKDTIEKVNETEPDLILMDIILKGELNGIETAKQIQKTHSIPIIYLTAYNDKKILDSEKTIEPPIYILKPYEDAELKTAINKALNK